MAEESRMNLAALQQRDPYINEIAETATQVALYSFNPKTNQWEKTSIEGSLFVYKRSASPNNGFMILNRLGLNNLIEPITKDLEFQLQDPFLLYRNTKAIYGIWFYDKDECARIGQLMNSLLQLAIDYHRAKSDMRQRRASESDSMLEKEESLPKNVDILQMLSKAQHEYDKSKCGSLPKARDPKPLIDNPNASATKASNLLRPTPLKVAEVNDEGGGEPDRTGAPTAPPATAPATGPGTAPISLETLFRNASLQQQSGNRQDQPRPQPFHRSVSMTEGDTKSQELLRHIMSSGSMVEDIERQQHRDVPPKPPSAPSLQTLPQNFKSDQRISPPNKVSERENKGGPVNTKYDLSPYLKMNEKEADCGSGEDKVRRKSPAVQETEGTESLLTPAALQTSLSLSAEVTSGLSRLLPQNPDVLLTPMAFTQSPKPGSPATTALYTTQDTTDDLPVAALTREQLQQALIHLIKNDSSFIDSIHQAYLNSLKLSHKT
ncbi:mRNA-decapping enzyme 1A-like [Saccostrea echinata]|uniref:mRNA-decapping enzyme 1A-like n=1 Tax=Saccostrea echinata TaxID=191078 RepID=UPI002A819733|nr:mRNA-decapping enzyme 1A-like [Saccostrea echinata]